MTRYLPTLTNLISPFTTTESQWKMGPSMNSSIPNCPLDRSRADTTSRAWSRESAI
ncbi:hypothetical protein [Streptomyces parvus]|uniref:hypothetical protein n=1 Tax=Streptomyces parvus TaxID=66428 RepID=UPI0033D066E4